MIKKEFITDCDIDLIQALNKNLGLNFVLIKTMLRKGDVKVNGKRVKQNIQLNNQDSVVCFYAEPEIEIIYEDNNILIVNKPKHIETINETDKNLTSILQKKFPTCMPCHRLDYNTSGIVVFALNEVALQEILLSFKQGRVQKKYFALTGGNPQPNEILQAFLIKNSEKSQVQICSHMKNGAVLIKTEYELIEKINNDLSLIEVTLHTGKTHQIRAHLAFNSMPILGDRKYGDKLLNEKYNKHTQCLISYAIKFDFDCNSELYYLSNKQFKLSQNKKELFKL